MGLLVPLLPATITSGCKPDWTATTSYKLELNSTTLQSRVIKCAYCRSTYPAQQYMVPYGHCPQCGAQLPVGVR